MVIAREIPLKRAIDYPTVFLFILILASLAQAQTRGIVNQPAPEWQVKQWFQLEDGKDSLDVSDFEDKVIYLYCFQSWCPGCHSHGFPTLQKVIEAYKDDPDVAIVAVQTTFEGFSQNGLAQAKQVAQKYNLDIPIGQSGSPGERSQLMRNYRTGGTPWTVIIDRQRIVRYNDFHIAPEQAIAMIASLKDFAKSEGPTANP